MGEKLCSKVKIKQNVRFPRLNKSKIMQECLLIRNNLYVHLSFLSSPHTDILYFVWYFLGSCYIVLIQAYNFLFSSKTESMITLKMDYTKRW